LPALLSAPLLCLQASLSSGFEHRAPLTLCFCCVPLRHSEGYCALHALRHSLISRKGNSATNDHIPVRSEEHTSELQSLMRTSYAVFCLKQQLIITYK